jgi:ribosomal protein L16 Arg81 hydroxylase
MALYDRGATIIINELQRRWPPLGNFCRCLENYFNHVFNTNIYLTPVKAQGFTPHYDTHDVFILQVFGTKRWRIYEGPIDLPLPDQPYDPDQISSTPELMKFEMQPGDLAYIPRGYVHEASSHKSSSVHITVGVITQKWIDLLYQCISHVARQDKRFRESLPFGGRTHSFESPAVVERLNELVNILISDFQSGMLKSIDETFVATRPPLLPGMLLDLERLSSLQLSSRVVVRQTIIFRLEIEDGEVAIYFHGKKVSCPRLAEPALRFIAKKQPFRVSALPGELTPAQKLELVRRLTREGFLTLLRSN